MAADLIKQPVDSQSLESKGGSKPRLKPHSKSRKGCRNCKVRKLKCDEAHPTCRRCHSYGVLCDYQSKTSDLQLLTPTSNNACFKIFGPSCHGISPWTNEYDRIFHRFQKNTAMTVSTGERLFLFQGDILRLAQSYSFLRETITTMTLMHENHNSGEQEHPTPILDPKEAYHLFQATSMFSKRIQALLESSGATADECAAIWATSALLGIISFSHIQASTFEEAWPLRANGTSEDLGWLRMSDGKESLRNLTMPLENHATYKYLVTPHADDMLPVSARDALFHKDSLAQTTRDDYLCLLTGQYNDIFESQCLTTIILSFWQFVYSLEADFKNSLVARDPHALIVLLHWYTKIHTLPIWWLKKRTLLEGQAICTYIDRHHRENGEVQRLIQWPRSVLFGC